MSLARHRPEDGAGLSFCRPSWRGRRTLEGAARRYGPALIAFLAVTAFLHRPLLEVRGFAPKDDWEALRLVAARPYHPQVERRAGDFGFINLKWEWELGRFTPAWSAVQALEARLFGSHPAAWQLETLALAVASALLLYQIFLRIGASFTPALLGGLWFLARGRELWVEKQYQEDTAVLWLLVAVVLFLRAARSGRRSLDWWGFAALVISGLTKESFVLLVPAVLFIRAWAGRGVAGESGPPRSLSPIRPVLFAAGAVFIGQVLLLAFLYLNGPYGRTVSGELGRFDLSQIVDVLRLNAPALSYFVPALGLAFVRRGGADANRRRETAALAFLVLAAWLIPQFVLFKETRLAGHYVYAAMPALTALNVLGLETLRRRTSGRTRALYAAMGAFAVYTIGLSLPATRNIAEFQAARTDAYAAASAFCAASLPAGSSMLIVSDRPWWGLGISLLFDFGRRGVVSPVSFDCPPVAAAARGNPGRAALSREPLSRELIARYFLPLTALPPDSLNAVFSILPAPLFRKVAASDYPWFVAGEWAEFPFESSYSRFETGSMWRPAWRRSFQRLRYAVFLRNGTRAPSASLPGPDALPDSGD